LERLFRFSRGLVCISLANLSKGYQMELALYFIGFVVVLIVIGLFIDCLTDL